VRRDVLILDDARERRVLAYDPRVTNDEEPSNGGPESTHNE
jgi:hypothetical protein